MSVSNLGPCPICKTVISGKLSRTCEIGSSAGPDLDLVVCPTCSCISAIVLGDVRRLRRATDEELLLVRQDPRAVQAWRERRETIAKLLAQAPSRPYHRPN